VFWGRILPYQAARQKHAKPKVEAFRTLAEQQFARIPGKGDLAKAFRYGLSRWPRSSTRSAWIWPGFRGLSESDQGVGLAGAQNPCRHTDGAI